MIIYKRTVLKYRKGKTNDSFLKYSQAYHGEVLEVTTLYLLGLPIFIWEKLVRYSDRT